MAVDPASGWGGRMRSMMIDQRVTRNLTSDPETGLGRWTEASIVQALRTGRAPDRVLNLWGMPWMYLHHFTENDARAVARYLKTLPPIRNYIPPALRFGVVETIGAKLVRPLPAAPPHGAHVCGRQLWQHGSSGLAASSSAGAHHCAVDRRRRRHRRLRPRRPGRASVASHVAGPAPRLTRRAQGVTSWLSAERERKP